MATLTLPIDEIVARYTQGETLQQLEHAYDCNAWTIKSRLLQSGVVLRPRGVAKGSRQGWYGRLGFDDPTLIADYQAGETASQIAARLGCCQKTVRNHLRDAGIARRAEGGQRKHSLNDTFFSKIDTEEKAYWLGFLLADGNVYRKGCNRVGIWLQKRDRKHLVKFLAAVGADVSIKESRLAGHSYVYVCLSSPQMCDDLERLECYARKSAVHGTPRIPKKLMRHLYRGYVDGDGCLLRNKPGQLAFYCTGSRRFIVDFQVWLVRHAACSQTKLAKAGRAVRLGYGGNLQVPRICRLLYSNVTIALDRKKRFADAVI